MSPKYLTKHYDTVRVRYAVTHWTHMPAVLVKLHFLKVVPLHYAQNYKTENCLLNIYKHLK